MISYKSFTLTNVNRLLVPHRRSGIITHLPFQIADQSFLLLPNKTMLWPSHQAILLADTHFGKAATFRNEGIPVPTGTTDVMLKRIGDTIDQNQTQSVYFLGDFCHSFSRYENDFVSELAQWRERYRHVEMTLILGNHDFGQQTLFHQLDLRVVQEPLLIDGIGLCHHPDTVVPEGIYKLAGHIHPAVSLTQGGDALTKIPCFHFNETVGVLPAFGEFTGTQRVKPAPSDHVFAVADDQVFPLVGASLVNASRAQIVANRRLKPEGLGS